MEYYDSEPSVEGGNYPNVARLFGEPPTPINWNILTADEADFAWHDLDHYLKWLKAAYGLAPAILPPYWHAHDELVWELSALHTDWLACYHETASPSAPIGWMRDFGESKHRLREWVSTSGTRLDRDRPTRQTPWPGEPDEPTRGEVVIIDRDLEFEEFVRQDVLRRRRIEAQVAQTLSA
ncbi:hypothetical protein [Nocardioides sp.]|uniref:hypothetical protein n=1 Tax=Nocardioides sp. TaxID=35761 RepID=UPI002C65DC98|nr:hypothetical protein [Nocardioides sp.]HXH78375.1 hypothetical protein [Nocardioides sp.]